MCSLAVTGVVHKVTGTRGFSASTAGFMKKNKLVRAIRTVSSHRIVQFAGLNRWLAGQPQQMAGWLASTAGFKLTHGKHHKQPHVCR
jgi:hypothetical protein